MRLIPKLNKKQSKEVDSQEGGNFTPLPAGIYHARLKDVQVRDSKSSDSKYWAWEFECVDDDFSNRRLWVNTSLLPQAQFKLKEVFAAFGVDADTDSDDLIGEIVKLQVTETTIQAGEKKGQTTNEVKRVIENDGFEVARKSDDDFGF